MKPRQSLRISWRAIRGHKLRSALTTLGIVIGIAAVIAFLTLGTSFKADVIGDVSADADPMLWAYTESNPDSGTGVQIGDSPVFTERDIAAMGDVEGVAYVGPLGAIEAHQATHDGERSTRLRFAATNAAHAASAHYVAGEPFEDGAAEAVINQQAAAVFEENLTIGDELTVHLANGSSRTVTVVGVTNESLGFSFGQEVPQVFLPADPYYQTQVVSPETNESLDAYPFVAIRAERLQGVDDVRTGTESYLNSSSDARELKGEEYRFTVQTEQDIVSQVSGILDQLTALITGIAVIALVVGSIGIANIMLVSVTERTREIGILLAIGARRRDVLQLFLVESSILGVIGAVFGVALGLAGGYLGTSLSDIPTVYPLEWVGIAIVVGMAVGIAAGLYPAWRAARVDPIEALRYE